MGQRPGWQRERWRQGLRGLGAGREWPAVWRRAEGTQPILQSSQAARTEIRGLPHRHRPAQRPSGFVRSSEAKRESEHTSILPIFST